MNYFIYFHIITDYCYIFYCFNVLKWRCKADHAFLTPKLGMNKKKERKKEREKKLSCATVKNRNQENIKVRELLSHIYRPHTHRNPSRDIDLRHPLFPRGLSDSQSYVLNFTNVDS